MDPVASLGLLIANLYEQINKLIQENTDLRAGNTQLSEQVAKLTEAAKTVPKKH